ncbi:MAG: 30S ribosome-binding factor RbfA [Desulfobacterota bacterium]|nr:30S ribosome-binding factor RbfA [Thermodesulfobacteriota bacterium]
MEGKRIDRVADLIRKEVAELFLRTVKDPRVEQVTITRVKLTGDFRLARIRFSVPGTIEERERALEGLNSAKGYIRRELARRVNLRHTPELRFEFDPSIEYSVRIGQVFHALHRQEGEGKDED